MNIKMVKFFLFPLFTFALSLSQAWADGTWVDCQRTNGYYQFFPATTLQIGKNAVAGDLLGNWVTSAGPTSWLCTPVSNQTAATPQMAVQTYSPYSIVGTTQADGQTYSVYNSVVKAGLGYIARWRYTVKGQTSKWYPLTTAAGVYQMPAELFTVNYDSGKSYNVGVDVQVRFVKTAATLTAGSVSAFDPTYMRTYQTYQGAIYQGGFTYMIADFQSGGLTISTASGTCTTSNVNVTLPPASRSGFRAIGYTTARTDFDIKFSQCPAGLASISYAFTPTTAIKDNTNGVFAPDSSSTASGVGLQMLTAQNIPISFNTAYLLTTYDPSVANASYSVPLRVGLYQTSNQVSPGNVSGSVTFTLSYK